MRLAAMMMVMMGHGFPGRLVCPICYNITLCPPCSSRSRRLLLEWDDGLPFTFAGSDMSEQKRSAVCVGEVRIELARAADGTFALSCGGDAFNTAIYLARAGVDVGFASAIGDDPYSDSVLALAAAEGVSSEMILRVARRQHGLCLIESGSAGERITRYWREGAPAAELFELPDWVQIAEK